MLRDLGPTELQPILLGAILRHDGRLTFRELDGILTDRMISPTDLRQAVRQMEEMGWVLGVRDRPDIMPRFHLTEEGRCVASRLGERME